MKKITTALAPALTLALLVPLSACTWVTLTPSGEKARVLSEAEVVNCKRLGTTTVTTKDKVANIYRNEDTVAKELETLARNSAYELGGDTVVPLGTPVEGTQSYAVYKCVP